MFCRFHTDRVTIVYRRDVYCENTTGYELLRSFATVISLFSVVFSRRNTVVIRLQEKRQNTIGYVDLRLFTIFLRDVIHRERSFLPVYEGRNPRPG